MSVNRKVTVPTGLCCIAPTMNPRLVEANAELAGLSHLALCEGRMDMEMRLSRGFLRANNLDCRRTSAAMESGSLSGQNEELTAFVELERAIHQFAVDLIS